LKWLSFEYTQENGEEGLKGLGGPSPAEAQRRRERRRERGKKKSKTRERGGSRDIEVLAR
jgi:hypothetical protein